MIKGKSNMVRSMGIYTLSNVLNAAIPFLLLPILTNYLSTSDYGILSNFNVLTNLMIPFVGINLMSSVQIQYLKEEIDNRNYLSSGLRLSVVLTLIFTIVLFILGGFFEEKIGIPKAFLFLVGIYALFNVIIEVLLSLWRMEDRASYYGIFRVSRTLVEIGLIILLVIVYRMDFEGSIYAMFIAYTLGGIAALIILAKKKLLFGTFSMVYLKHAINYGVPLIPHTLGGIVIMYSDKLILTYYWGLSANGIYSVGFMVGQIIGLLQNSFNQAWVPWVFQKLKNGTYQDKEKMVKITYLYFFCIIAAVLCLWLITPVIYGVLGKDFKAGMDLVLWIALGFAFNGMYKMISVYIFYIEKTIIIAYSSAGVAILNIILNFWLIPVHGPQGAALATMSSLALQFLVTWWISSRLIKMPWLLTKSNAGN